MGCGCGKKSNRNKLPTKTKILLPKIMGVNKLVLDSRIIACKSCQFYSSNKKSIANNMMAGKCRKIGKKLYAILPNPKIKCPIKKF